jgi:hypothetical protein
VGEINWKKYGSCVRDGIGSKRTTGNLEVKLTSLSFLQESILMFSNFDEDYCRLY